MILGIVILAAIFGVITTFLIGPGSFWVAAAVSSLTSSVWVVIFGAWVAYKERRQ